MVFQPRDQKGEWDDDGIIRKLGEYERGHELVLVNTIRDVVKKWRADDYPGVTRTTYDLLQHWRSPDRQQRRFFAQLEAAETVVVEAAKAMLAFDRDETDGQRVVVFRGTEREAVVTAASAFSSARIAELRARPKQSQPIFALMLNVSVETVRAWEQGRRTPEGSALRLLQVADASPEVLLRNVDVK